MQGVVLAGNSFGVRGLSSSDVSRSRFVDNETGLWVGPGAATVDLSVFVDNSTGAGSGDGSSLTIARSRFTGNETGMECAEASCTVTSSSSQVNDTGPSTWSSSGEVRGNRFLRNERGAYLSFESDMLVGDKTFAGSPVGLEADVTDRSVLLNNTFRRRGPVLLTRPDEQMPDSYTTLEGTAFTGNTDGVLISQPGAARKQRGDGQQPGGDLRRGCRRPRRERRAAERERGAVPSRRAGRARS